MVKADALKQRRVVSILSLEECDSDVTVYPPSIVDSSQYESLSEIVAKYNRGEPILSSSRVDAVQLESEAKDPEAVLADMSVMRESGADIVDASAALRKGEEAKVELSAYHKAIADKDKADKDAVAKADADELKAARAAKRDVTPA